MGAAGCPHPSKKGYRTRAAAKKHMWQLLKRGTKVDWQTLNVYLCKCGKHHVGHRNKSRKKST